MIEQKLNDNKKILDKKATPNRSGFFIIINWIDTFNNKLLFNYMQCNCVYFINYFQYRTLIALSLLIYTLSITYVISIQDQISDSYDNFQTENPSSENSTLNYLLNVLISFTCTNWIYLCYLPVVNFILTMTIGKYALSGILYPY